MHRQALCLEIATKPPKEVAGKAVHGEKSWVTRQQTLLEPGENPLLPALSFQRPLLTMLSTQPAGKGEKFQNPQAGDER